MRGYIVAVSDEHGERYACDSMTRFTSDRGAAKVYKTEAGAIRAANRIAHTNLVVIPVTSYVVVVPVTSYVSVRKAVS